MRILYGSCEKLVQDGAAFRGQEACGYMAGLLPALRG